MADGPPTLACSSLSVPNHNKSQTVRAKQISVTSRSKIVTRPRTLLCILLIPSSRAHFRFFFLAAQLGRKMSLPRPQTLIMNPHLREARMAHPTRIALTCRKTPRAGPSGEHRWFPFTRRRPMLPSAEMFGAEPSLTRLERRPTISLGFHHRDDRSLELGNRSPEHATTFRTLDQGFRIALPTTPATPYTLPQSRTPGWDSPWAAARPLESFSHRNIYEQLQNGESAEEQPVDDSTTTNGVGGPEQESEQEYIY